MLDPLEQDGYQPEGKTSTSSSFPPLPLFICPRLSGEHVNVFAEQTFNRFVQDPFPSRWIHFGETDPKVNTVKWPFEGKTLILRTNCLVKSKSRASSLITFLHLAAGVTLNNSPPNVSSALLTQKTHPFWLTHYRILIAFLPGHYTFLSNQSNQFFCAPSSSTCPQFITHCFQRKRWKWLNAFKRRCWKR